MATKLKGKDCKVTLGSDKVTGLGDWSISGVTADQIEITEFGDEWKHYVYSLKDGGTVSFSGFFHADDITGQQKLIEANLYNSGLTTLKFYINDTSYFTPNQTTGYFSPNLTTGAPTELGNVCITSYDVKAEKAGLVQVTFQGKVSGCMVLI